jgi:hypothetical protein
VGLSTIAGALVAVMIGGCPSSGTGGNGGPNAPGVTPADTTVRTLDGAYTANKVTLVFKNNTGQSLITDRQQLYDWANLAGLVDASKQPKQSQNPSKLGGVQSVLPGGARHVAFLGDGAKRDELTSTLESLTLDVEAATVVATFALEVHSAPADGSPATGTPKVAHLTLSWTGVKREESAITAQGSQIGWTSPDGTQGAQPLGDGAFAQARGQDGATLEGLWGFYTLFPGNGELCGSSFSFNLFGGQPANPPTYAKWTCDYSWALYSAQLDANGNGQEIVLSPSTVPDMLRDTPVLMPFGDMDSVDLVDALPRAFNNFMGIISDRVPLGENHEWCFPAYGSRDYCRSIRVDQMSVTSADSGYAAVLAGQQNIWYTDDPNGEPPLSQSVFQFSHGVLRVRQTPLHIWDGHTPGTVTDGPVISRLELVFTQLDYHSHIVNGQEEDGAGDPNASITLLGSWITPKLAVEMQPADLTSVPPDAPITLTLSAPDGDPGTLQYAWAFFGPWPSESWPAADVRSATLQLTAPHQATRPDDLISGDAAQPIVIVGWAFDDGGHIGYAYKIINIEN